MASNEEYQTEFEVDDSSKAVLRIHNNGVPNREKITADQISSTSFQARLAHVQYGTYDGEPAALVIFHFQFSFRNGSWKRIKYASIQLTFEETTGPELALPNPRNPNNDPIVAMIAPVQVLGEVTTTQKTRNWKLSLPVQFQKFGIQSGPEIDLEIGANFSTDDRMWLVATPTSEDDHHANNRVTWEIRENRTQGSGILHRFPGAVVITLPKDPQHHVRITGLIEPSVVFSVNPLRLKQKKDDPVYLDRITEKGKPILPGVDFKDEAFKWEDIVKIPTEYEVWRS